MAELVWGETGTKFYEGGVDRVVLYPNNDPAEVWTGVVSIEESQVGGEIKPYYFDGKKMLDLVENSDFQAVITAIDFPEAFYVCDGVIQIQRGLRVKQQPRKFFGLSYRTMIYNDLGEVGYKIHLVYNALASSSARNNTTKSERVDIIDYKWTIDTIPLENSTRRPTAHVVVSTEKFSAGQITALEDILYGTVSVDAALPTRAVLESTLGGL